MNHCSQFCFPASGLEAMGCPEPYHMFDTGWRKILGFLASASRTRALTILSCSAAVSRMRVRCRGRKRALPGEKETWLHTVLRAVD